VWEESRHPWISLPPETPPKARRKAGVINNRRLPSGADLPCHGLLAADTDPPTQNDIASEAASPGANHANPRRDLRDRQSGRGLAGRRNIAQRAAGLESPGRDRDGAHRYLDDDDAITGELLCSGFARDAFRMARSANRSHF
jgi:hypothetical protein